MKTASKVMYSIANVFNWIMVVFCIVGIVLSSLSLAGALGDFDLKFAGIASIVTLAIVLIFCIVTICLVRMAKKNGTSKGWDILFIVIGVLDWNIFYFLGGLFGVLAPSK